MTGILEGVRVIDITHVKAGPTCTQILADMGAEIIRVEKPGGGIDRDFGPYTPDGRSVYLAYTCRNKKGITLNLQKPRGNEILYKLIKKVDVVVESFGAYGNKQLGVDYHSLRRIKKDIIVVSVSAYGQNGPYAERIGFDAMAQAISGLMWVTGFPETEKPVRLGVSFVDIASGILGALGAVLAIYHRGKTGKGQLVDISLLDTAMMFTETLMGEYKVAGKERPQVGNASVLLAPYDSFPTKDGWVFIGVLTNIDRFFQLIGQEQLTADPRFHNIRDIASPENRLLFAERIGAWTSQHTRQEVVMLCNKAGIPCAPINKIPETMHDPQIIAREMIVELAHPGIGMVPLPGIPLKLSETPGEIKTPFPEIGQHNEEVYSQLLGFTAKDITQLEKDGII